MANKSHLNEIAGLSNSERRRRLFMTLDRFQKMVEEGETSLDPTVSGKLLELGLILIPREESFFIFPQPDGSGQLEWERDGVSVLIAVSKHE